MRTGDFDYTLPPELIAQSPIEPRDHSRLMVLDRANQAIRHEHFYQLPGLLQPGDVLVFNDTRVIPARLYAQKDTGAKLEVLLLQKLGPGVWQTLVKPAKRISVGSKLIVLGTGNTVGTEAEVIAEQDAGIRVIRFADDRALATLGNIPLPPYIHERLTDPERYQTVYSRIEGSAAAPTAGLHFTPGLLKELDAKKYPVACLSLSMSDWILFNRSAKMTPANTVFTVNSVSFHLRPERQLPGRNGRGGG